MTVTRVRWGGSLLEEARVHGRVKLLSVMPHTVEAAETGGGPAEVERFTPALSDADLVVRVVERVVQEFNGQDVQLIAVNLEEPAKQITATLERHKLEVTVAMDIDGVVATKYEANAIPQTVIIGRDGNIDYQTDRVIPASRVRDVIANSFAEQSDRRRE